MSNEQVGNRIPTHPTKKPTKSVSTEVNPVTYENFRDTPMQSGSAGGGYVWTSHPHPEETVKTHHT